MCIRSAVLFSLVLASSCVRADFAESPQDYLAMMDADGDGSVIVGEYEDYMSESFRAMDRNANSVLDLDEFPPGTVGANTRPLPLRQHLRNLDDAFDRQDRDRNGRLDARELALPPG